MWAWLVRHFEHLARKNQMLITRPGGAAGVTESSCHFDNDDDVIACCGRFSGDSRWRLLGKKGICMLHGHQIKCVNVGGDFS